MELSIPYWDFLVLNRSVWCFDLSRGKAALSIPYWDFLVLNHLGYDFEILDSYVLSIPYWDFLVLNPVKNKNGGRCEMSDFQFPIGIF